MCLYSCRVYIILINLHVIFNTKIILNQIDLFITFFPPEHYGKIKCNETHKEVALPFS